jgi:hypothetical protein
MGRKKVGYHQANTQKKYLIDLVGFDKKKKKKIDEEFFVFSYSCFRVAT